MDFIEQYNLNAEDQDSNSDSDNESFGSDDRQDDDDFVDELTTKPNTGQTENQVKNLPFIVLSKEKIAEAMEDIIREVQNLHFEEIATPVVRALLNHKKWVLNKVVDQLCDEPDKIFNAARVVNPYKLQEDTEASTKPDENEVNECQICCTEFPPSEMTGMKCGHQFCENCWRRYLTNKIMEEGRGEGITCAEHNCYVLVDDEIVMRLVHDNVQIRFQHLITNSFVECSKYLTWCPEPGCDNAIQVKVPDCKKVTCECGRTFCFACREIYHEPIDCRLFEKWLKRCNEKERIAWLNANTKRCPNCRTYIEKNGGCDSIKCVRKNCNYEFCWACLGSWSMHFIDGCEDHVEESDSESSTYESSDRYEHYYIQYITNQNLLERAEENLNLGSILNNKNRVKEKYNFSLIGEDTIKFQKAVKVLRQCRETLMVTYAFTYYFKSDNNLLIFEDNQKDLQIATDELSSYLTSNIKSENTQALTLITDKISYCQNRQQVLLDHAKEGFAEGSWQLIE